MTVSSEPYVSLEDVLNEIFSNYDCRLLTINCNTVAILKYFGEKFKIFDSHSKDLYGMPVSYRECVLVDVSGIQDTVKFFQMTCTGSLGRYVSFEIKGVLINPHFPNIYAGCMQTVDQSVFKQCNDQATNLHNQNQQYKCNSEKEKYVSISNKAKQLSDSCEYDKRKRATESPVSREKRQMTRRLRYKRMKENESIE